MATGLSSSQNPQDNSKAIATLKNAIATDPRYGRAHALLAWCHSQDVVYLWSSDPETSRQCARTAVDAASGLISDDPTAMAAVGAAISQCLDDLPRAAAYIVPSSGLRRRSIAIGAVVMMVCCARV